MGFYIAIHSNNKKEPQSNSTCTRSIAKKSLLPKKKMDNNTDGSLTDAIPLGIRTTEGLECWPYEYCVENPYTLGEDRRSAREEEFADFHLNWVLDQVPGYEDYGLIDYKEEGYLYYPFTRAEWWEYKIVPMLD